MKTIHDFGSKIGGARKDVWVKRGLCIEDTKNMTASEKEKYIKRDYIWPKPDTQDELEKGFSRFIVYWHNEMRKTVTPKKNNYISAEEYINGVRKIRAMVEAVKTEKEISDFEQKALDGVFLQKKYGRAYEYIAPFENILNGNKFLKNTGTYGLLNMKCKMGKENFAMTEDEIMKKQFPVFFIDGDKCSVAEDRGRTILIYKSGCSAYYCYPKPNVVLVDKTSDDGITPDNNTLRKIAEYLKIDYNSLLTLKPVGVKSEMQLNQREIKNMNAAQQEQSAFSEQSNLVRRLVLFVNGMSNDFFLLSTDAPQKYIEEYCKWYNKWMEDGGQGDPLEPLRKKYYVNLLIDSETSDREELEAIIDGKTVESYDLFRYWDDK